MSAVILDLREADPKFKLKVRQIPGAEKLTLCFQCGSCTADCPVARRRDVFRPRTIARLAILGFKELLLSGDLLWLCLGCYNCTEHCPQGVKPTEVIEALRNIAVEEGKLHPGFKQLLEALLATGRMYKITRMKERTRAKMGLPPVPEVPLEDVRKVLDLAGLTAILGKASGGGEA